MRYYPKIGSGGSSTDELVKASPTDSLAATLSETLVGGSGIDITVVGGAGTNQTIQIENTRGDEYVRVSANDTTVGDLWQKLQVVSPITRTEMNNGGNEYINLGLDTSALPKDTEQKYLTIGEGVDVLLADTRGKFLFISEAYTITGWRLHEASLMPVSGSIVLDIRTGTTYAGSTSIAGSEKPTLTAANNNSDTTLSSWTPSLSAGTFVWFNIDSVTDCKKVILTLEMVKT